MQAPDHEQPDDHDEIRLQHFAMMSLIRVLEERCEVLFREGRVKGAMHLCIGQEAVATGVCAAMRPDDAISFTYRGHGWALAKGISAYAVLAECFGRIDGCSGGRGGSKHLGDWSKRVLPSNAIVAGGMPLAAGVALASKLLGTGNVAVAVFGEGATNQGVFHETMTLASLWQLPLLLVCENNQYSELTPAHDMLPVEHLSERSSGYGIPATDVDGMDVEAVAEAASTALARARSGHGPTFLVADTYRFCGHMTGDAWQYRTKEEVQAWRERDPIATLRHRLLTSGTEAAVLEALDVEARRAVEDAEKRAHESPLPDPADIGRSAPSWGLVVR